MYGRIPDIDQVLIGIKEFIRYETGNSIGNISNNEGNGIDTSYLGFFGSGKGNSTRQVFPKDNENGSDNRGKFNTNAINESISTHNC